MEAQGAPHQGASWYAIGTALHTAYERVLKKPPVRMSTAQRWARKEMEAEIAKLERPFLESPHRPIDGKSEYELADQLMENFWVDVIETPHPMAQSLHTFELEKNVVVRSTDWEWSAGASTTIDYLGWDIWHQGKDNLVTDGFTIIDWKTGRSRSSDPMQLQFYRYLLERLGYQATQNGPWGAFYHAEHRTWQEVEDYDIDAVERMITETQLLKQLPHPEPRPNWFCDYCPFKISCPAWQEDEHDEHVAQTQMEENIKLYDFKLDA